MRNTIKTRTTHNEVEKSKFSPEKPLKRAKFVPKRKQQRKIAVIIASFVGKKNCHYLEINSTIERSSHKW
jgi:hypothetical protein